MPSNKFVVSNTELEPLTVTVEQTKRLTGESRSQIYNLIGCGTYQAVKSGRRTLISYDSVKRRQAALPRAKIKPPKPRDMRSEARSHERQAAPAAPDVKSLNQSTNRKKAND